jgi:hypothetical protein
VGLGGRHVPLLEHVQPEAQVPHEVAQALGSGPQLRPEQFGTQPPPMPPTSPIQPRLPFANKAQCDPALQQ